MEQSQQTTSEFTLNQHGTNNKEQFLSKKKKKKKQRAKCLGHTSTCTCDCLSDYYDWFLAFMFIRVIHFNFNL